MFQEEVYENYDLSSAVIDMNELAKKKFKRCNFSNTDFTDLEIIYGCEFDHCNFSSAELNGVTIRNCAFLNCKFAYTNFFATVIEDSKMLGSDFTNADCDLLDIRGVDWSYTILRSIELSKKEFSKVNFYGADLSGSRFNKCKIRDCDFKEATVHQASFRDSDIRGSNIENLDILALDLTNTKVDLQQCIIIAETHGVQYIDAQPVT